MVYMCVCVMCMCVCVCVCVMCVYTDSLCVLGTRCYGTQAFPTLIWKISVKVIITLVTVYKSLHKAALFMSEMLLPHFVFKTIIY